MSNFNGCNSGCGCNPCQCKKPKKYNPVEIVTQSGDYCVVLHQDWWIDEVLVKASPSKTVRLEVNKETYTEIKDAGAGKDCNIGSGCPPGPPGPAGAQGCPGPLGPQGCPGIDGEAQFIALSDGDLKASSAIDAAFGSGALGFGDLAITGEYHPGTGCGGNKYRVVPNGTANADGGSVIQGNGYQLIALFTIATPFMFGAKGDKVSDDVERWEAFIDYIRSTNAEHPYAYKIYDMSGDFGISRRLDIDLEGMARQHNGRVLVRGRAIFHMLAPSDFGVWVKDAGNAKFEIMEVVGQGGPDYTSRTLTRGFKISNSSLARFDELTTLYAKKDGIIPDETTSDPNSFIHINRANSVYCGTNGDLTTQLNSPSSVLQSITREGNANALSQRTALQMTASLPPDLEIDDYILARDPDTKTGFRLHTVLSIDTASNTVRVYPWVSNVVEPGEQMGWVWGMNVDISHSNDTNSLQVKEARAFVTGGNVRVDTTVGTTVDHVYSQASAANIIVGKGLPNSFVGFTEFKAAQHEGGIGVVLNSISAELTKVSGEVSADEVQIGYAPRTAADKILTAVSGTLGKIILIGNDGIRQPTGTMPCEASFGTQVFRLNSARKHVVYNRSSGTVILEWDFHENDKFGAQQTWLTWLAGKAIASAKPTGTLTLRPGSADLADGWAIGSEATGYGTSMSITATGTEPPVILATARPEAKRYHIRVL